MQKRISSVMSAQVVVPPPEESMLESEAQFKNRLLENFKFISRGEKFCSLANLVEWLLLLDKSSNKVTVFALQKEFQKNSSEGLLDKKGLIALMTSLCAVEENAQWSDEFMTRLEGYVNDNDKKREELKEELRKAAESDHVQTVMQFEQELINIFVMYNHKNIDGELETPWETVQNKNLRIGRDQVMVFLQEANVDVSPDTLASLLALFPKDLSAEGLNIFEFTILVILLALRNIESDQNSPIMLQSFLKNQLSLRTNL